MTDIILVIVLSIGTFSHPQPSDLACNQAVVQAQVQAARDYPGAQFISARCKRT
jgi:hypothetical protein